MLGLRWVTGPAGPPRDSQTTVMFPPSLYFADSHHALGVPSMGGRSAPWWSPTGLPARGSPLPSLVTLEDAGGMTPGSRPALSGAVSTLSGEGLQDTQLHWKPRPQCLIQLHLP